MREISDFSKAILAVWLIVSLLVTVILLLPFVVSQEALGRVLPPCQRVVTEHKECLTCGMTTAFYRISRLDFKGAMRANRGSIPLFCLFFFNEALFSFVLVAMFTRCSLRKPAPREAEGLSTHNGGGG